MSNGYKIIVCRCDDWEGIYIDGVLKFEHHKIEVGDWLNIIERYKNFEGTCVSYWIEDEYMHDLGSLPRRFSDLPKEVFL